MKYDRIEKALIRKNANDEELIKLAKTYAKSSSMAEFKLKTAVYRNKGSKLIKWFSLFYFVKNYSIYDTFPWLVSILFAILSMIGLFWCVDLTSHISESRRWQSLCGMFFALGALVMTGCAFMVFHKIKSTLEIIKNAVWKYE